MPDFPKGAACSTMTSESAPFHPRDLAKPWAVVGVAMGLLAALGVAVFGDYSVWADSKDQRDLGHVTLDLAQGDGAGWGSLEHDIQHYGAAFEMPLALVERALGQADSRDIYLTRHLLSHLAFLAGAGAAALLARRLFGGIWPALFALAAFALHPRLYAHSFFNTKDAPFAALFMVCLCLAERAFRRGTAGAFALLGAGVGVLVNLRVMGALLFAAVLGLRAMDVALAPGRTARHRALGSGAAFMAATAAALYAVSPHLWPDPSRLLDAFALLSQHPFHGTTLVAGTAVHYPNIPADYVPTWVAVTTPPALLALCLAGAAAALGRGLAPLGGAVRDAPPRFGLLLVACPVLAIAAVVAVNANLYHGWRHLYFLWAPASLLAAAGARWLVVAGRRPGLRRAAGGLAAAGVAAGAAQAALIHPQQHTYFNLLADRDAPERLATWYETDTQRMSHQQALERALDAHPGATVWTRRPHHGTLLHGPERRRLVFRGGMAGAADLVARPGPRIGAPFAPDALTVRVYDNTLFAVVALDVSLLGDATLDAWQARYRAAAAEPRLAHSDYDLHLGSGALTWLRAPCGAAGTAGRFASTAWPADGGAAASVACDFDRCGVRVDGACMARTPLPRGALKAIVAGQRLRHGPYLWRVAAAMGPAGAAAVDAPHPAPPGERVARGRFDLHLDGTTLTYVKAPCRPEDMVARFFLHVHPVDPSVLTAKRQLSGFHNLDFDVNRHNAGMIARLGGRCVAWARLPDYPIARLRTGQFDMQRNHWIIHWTIEIKEPTSPRDGLLDP